MVYRILLLFFMGGFSLFAQNSIKGKVTDQFGTIIPGAEVYLQDIDKLAIADFDGVYLLEEVPSGSHELVVFAYEFKVFNATVNVASDLEQNIKMEANAHELSEVVLTQQREEIFALKKLKKVEGTAIYAGKKTEVVLLDQLTVNMASNNARQIYSQVAGLNIYDNGDAGLQLNIGGRGLDPNRTANFNTRQNGYDISADALGYPESYYTPPAEAISEIQIVRGAASLQYGPQFGGLVNFKLKKPNPVKKFEFITRQTLGSNGLFTSFNSVGGTVGKLGYYGYFNFKEGDGFRPNSGFNSKNGYAYVDYAFSAKTKLSAEITILDYLAQQAGGLTDAQFYKDPTFSNRARNWFQVDWKLLSVNLEHKISAKSDFSLKVTTLDASREALGFRQNRVSQPDDLEEPRELLVDNFTNWSVESRWLTRYTLGGKDAVLLLGAKYYQTDNDQKQGPGSTASDPDFTFYEDEYPNYQRQSEFNFPNLNAAFFGEHIFNLSDYFSITPGFRFEYIKNSKRGGL